MFINEERVRAAIAYECDRQHVGEDRRNFLYSAYVLASELYEDGIQVPSLEDALHLAGMLEPDSGGKIRRTPVTFADGGGSTSPDALPNAVKQLFNSVEDFTSSEEDVRYWVKEFLYCHPLTDGNGRLAFVLYNWIRGSLEDPVQLPYFFGEV